MVRTLIFVGIAIFTFLMGCAGSHVRPEVGAQSEAKDITIALPELKAFSEDTTLQAKLTGYQLDIMSSVESCQHKVPYINKLSTLLITTKILKNCDYTVKLGIGAISVDGLKIDELYYFGEANLSQAQIAEQIAKGAAGVQIEIMLKPTEAGEKLGFTSSVKTEAIELSVTVKLGNESKNLKNAVLTLCQPGIIGCAESIKVDDKDHLLILDDKVKADVKASVTKLRQLAESTGKTKFENCLVDGSSAREKGHFPNPVNEYDVYRPTSLNCSE